MSFVLFDTDVKQYICWESEKITWTQNQSSAKKFRDNEHVQRFKKSPLKPYCAKAKIEISRFQAVQIGEKPQISAQTKNNSSNDTPLPVSTPSTPAAEYVSENIKPLKIAEPESKPLDLSDIENILSDIPSAVSSILALYGQIDTAIEYCNHTIRNTDLETSDLLHKCEFSNPNAADGYKFFKEIQICRIRRRKAKDMLQLLEIIRDSGIVNTAYDFDNRYGTCQHILENRTYRPRIREDLFTDIQTHSNK